MRKASITEANRGNFGLIVGENSKAKRNCGGPNKHGFGWLRFGEQLCCSCASSKTRALNKELKIVVLLQESIEVASIIQ